VIYFIQVNVPHHTHIRTSTENTVVNTTKRKWTRGKAVTAVKSVSTVPAVRVMNIINVHSSLVRTTSKVPGPEYYLDQDIKSYKA
jgi:hypothetical protein